MRLVLVLVLLGSLLSGCTAIGGDGPDLMTAKQALRPAERAAEGWAEDAVLIDANANELDDEARREAADEIADSREELKEARDDGDIEDSDYDNFTEMLDVGDIVVSVNDDNVGDGRASVWGFTYASAEKKDMLIVAVGHGKVVYKQPMVEMYGDDFDFEDLLDFDAVGDWKVDSDDAAQAATLGDEDYSRLCGATNVVSFMSLSPGEGDGPVWYVGVETMDSEGDEADEAWVAVDAVNGSLIVDEDVITPIEDLLYQESGMMGGDLTGSVQVSTSEAFEIFNEGHMMLAVDVAINRPPPQPIHVTVTDPAGAVTEFDVAFGSGSPFFTSQSVLLPSAGVGQYSVALDVPLAIASTYTISYCTDGVPTAQGDFQVRACNEIAANGGGGAAARGETLSSLGRWLAAW